MQYVSASDAKQKLAAILDAAQREPIMIRRQKRDVAVLVSAREYKRLRALNCEEFERFCDQVGKQVATRGLTAKKLGRILADDG